MNWKPVSHSSSIPFNSLWRRRNLGIHEYQNGETGDEKKRRSFKQVISESIASVIVIWLFYTQLYFFSSFIFKTKKAASALQ
jgi:hypothetical protein